MSNEQRQEVIRKLQNSVEWVERGLKEIQSGDTSRAAEVADTLRDMAKSADSLSA